jgi:preprotein translocase subunit SecA
MTLQERREALQKMDSSNFGLYEAEIKHFLQYFEEMALVKKLGGLHVIGSERHEARRIDNQLRGRAARQGDPGSSRFYLSMQDDLMRLFGGDQVGNLMGRLKVDDSLPLEVRLVSNIIEGSQTRVEGANFDVRKHLLEYDDVLNKQRQQIYDQRDRIFVKEDLSDDVNEMLEAEVTKRVEAGLADEEGAWRLIAWLDQVQPAFESKNGLYPSFGFKLLLNQILQDDVKNATLNIVSKSIEAEYAHANKAIENLMNRTQESLDAQISDREDALDAYFQTLRDMEEMPRPQKIQEEINALARLPLRFNNEVQKMLADDPEDAKELIQEMVANELTKINATRVIGAIQNRLGEQLQLQSPLPSDWDELADILLYTTREAFDKKRERLNHQIARDIDVLLQREDVSTDAGKLRLLMTLSQGTRTAFDQKTHKQVKQIFNRFTYAFYAAQLLEGKDSEEVIDDVMNHLEEAEKVLQETLGELRFMELKQNAVRIADFGIAAKMAFGEEKLNEAVSSLSKSEAESLSKALGRYILNENHRQLLLGAFSELWVEYLTKVEALRVSIGLEAYGQRDPLVQYKSQASEMFAQLLEDVRGLVIGRAFAARPRRVEITPLETAEVASAAVNETSVQIGEGASGSKKKRRRRN